MVYHYEAKNLTNEGLQISGIIPVLDEILTLLSINDVEYLNELKNLYQNENDTSKILDILGSLFGLNRIVSVTYMSNSQEITETLSLNDEVYLTYIKCQIIKNNYDGSYKQFKAYYDLAGLKLGVVTYNSIDLSASIATNHLYLLSTNTDIQKLFLSGKLTLESMGIQYIYSILDVTNALKLQGFDGNYNYEWFNGEGVLTGIDREGGTISTGGTLI